MAEAMVEVLEVSVEEPSGDGPLAGVGIDMPSFGATRATFDLEVRGWAVGRGSAPAGVEIAHGEEVLARAPIEIERPNVAAAHPATEAGDAVGFRTLVGLLRAPAEFELTVRVVTRAGEEIPVARLGGRRAEVRTGFVPSLEPLMVTTLGRTGSMMLMQMLEAHPEILVYRPFRYEQRVASYWIEVLLALAEPASWFRQVAPAGSLDEPRWWLGEDGATPTGLRDEALQQWMGGEAVRELAEVSQTRIERLYGRLASRLENGPAPRFFAEKYALGISHLVRELYPGAREIFLVRDFRDMVCSIIAFNKKRGVQGFGREAAASDLDYVASLGRWAEGLQTAYERRAGSAIVIRYEDLVLEPRPTLEAMLDHIGVDSGSGVLDAMVEALGRELGELRGHRTSADPRSSIGRWREDLGDELGRACEESFGSALEAFGYYDRH
jgi:Sulfotransferase family